MGTDKQLNQKEQSGWSVAEAVKEFSGFLSEEDPSEESLKAFTPSVDEFKKWLEEKFEEGLDLPLAYFKSNPEVLDDFDQDSPYRGALTDIKLMLEWAHSQEQWVLSQEEWRQKWGVL